MSLARVPEIEAARPQHRRADETCAEAEERLAEEERQGDPEEAGQRRGQPGRHLVQPPAAELGHARRRPEVERRLVRIEVPEEMRHQPRPAAHHLARGEGVLRLERMAEDLAAEPWQVEERAEREDEEERAGAATPAHAAHPARASLASST